MITASSPVRESLRKSCEVDPSSYFANLRLRPVRFTSPSLDFTPHAKELEDVVSELCRFRDNYYTFYPLTCETKTPKSAVTIESSLYDRERLTKVCSKRNERLRAWINQSLEFFNRVTLPAVKRRKSSVPREESAESAPSLEYTLSEHEFDPTLDREQRAFFSYLRGVIYNAGPGFNALAEANLQKAVKLNPELEKAWIELGFCVIKSPSPSRLDDARQYFEAALAHKRSVEALRCMSTLLRQIPVKSSATALVNLEESIRLLKEAVRQDMGNGSVWLGLALAYMRQFFSFSLLLTDLKSSLSAFQRALMDDRCLRLADLYYSRASIYCYLEQYNMALADYELAFQCDPAIMLEQGIPSEDFVKNCVKLNELVMKRANLKPKKFAQLLDKLCTSNPAYIVDGKVSITSFSAFNSNGDGTESPQTFPVHADFSKLVQTRSLEDLVGHANSLNLGTAFRCLIIGESISHFIYRSFVGMDSAGTCFAISVFNISTDSVKVGDELIVLNPCAQAVELCASMPETNETVKLNYTTLRIEDPQQTLINGQVLGNKNAAWTRLNCSIR